jgi:hypothetical protein
MVDFLEALKKEEWDLHELVCYINNEEPYEDYTSLDPTDTSPTANYVKKYRYEYRTYKSAMKDIYNLILKPLRVDKYTKDGEYNFIFKPRYLLKWVQKSKIDIIYNLNEYLNYQYWITKESWTFNENVILLTSKECPLPYEIFNTLESTDEEIYNIATRLRDAINQKFNDNDDILGCYAFEKFGTHSQEYEIFKLYALEWAYKSNIKIPDVFQHLIKDDADKTYNNYYLTDMAKQNDYKNWLALPSCTIREGTSILLGLRIYARDGQFKHSLHHSELKELLKRAVIAKDIDVLQSQNTANYFDDYVKPKSFLKWAIDKNLKMPEELLKLYKSEQDNIIHLNKYSSRMDLENQNEIGSKIISSIPAISPTNTENWREDVKMAFTDYYNENKVAPTAQKLCAYIRQKKDNKFYAQHIESITHKKPLKIVNGIIKEEIGWDTFTKAITATKKHILESS